MHTPILLAVEARTEQQAIEQAEYFNEHNTHWSDWSELGGRYLNEVGGTGVFRYSDDPEKFETLVARFKLATSIGKDSYMEKVGEVTVSELVRGDDYTRWMARKLLDVVSEDFTPDQHFYDIVEYCANEVALKERITKNPDEQFIIIWDYHY
jgi:hypothetical protein